uniref:Uncharacterized protein n=1 Tax=Caenorhabditis japonica TaxID=281687 RepID=A0A8R1DY55_CAEJA
MNRSIKMREDVLLRKLLSDGEGIGEDRRVQQIGSFLRDSRTVDDIKLVDAVKIIKCIDLLEMSSLKQKLVARMNRNMAQDFNNLTVEIDNEIDRMYNKMEAAKIDLTNSKLVKKNRQKYRELVNSMEAWPSRADSMRKLVEVKDELLRQHDRQKLLEVKLNDRRNNLIAFNVMLANFQKFITEDDEIADEHVASRDDENDDSPSVD